MTAEDPSNSSLPINQVQMKDQIRVGTLPLIARLPAAGPNIILVGEIRDFGPAEIAVKAALTGHLVLSTLHTNDARPPSAFDEHLELNLSWSRLRST